MKRLAKLLSECDNIDVKFHYSRHMSVNLEGQTRESLVKLLNSPEAESENSIDNNAMFQLLSDMKNVCDKGEKVALYKGSFMGKKLYAVLAQQKHSPTNKVCHW